MYASNILKLCREELLHYDTDTDIQLDKQKMCKRIC